MFYTQEKLLLLPGSLSYLNTGDKFLYHLQHSLLSGFLFCLVFGLGFFFPLQFLTQTKHLCLNNALMYHFVHKITAGR